MTLDQQSWLGSNAAELARPAQMSALAAICSIKQFFAAYRDSLAAERCRHAMRAGYRRRNRSRRFTR